VSTRYATILIPEELPYTYPKLPAAACEISPAGALACDTRALILTTVSASQPIPHISLIPSLPGLPFLQKAKERQTNLRRTRNLQKEKKKKIIASSASKLMPLHPLIENASISPLNVFPSFPLTSKFRFRRAAMTDAWCMATASSVAFLL
jgi:hypothetical protein